MSNKKWEEQIFAHENEYELSIRWIISWLGEHKAQGKKDIIKLITSLIDQKLTEQREEIVRELEAILDYCKDDDGLIDKDLTVMHGVGGLVDLINKLK